MNAALEKYKKKLIKFNPKVKVLVAKNTLQFWDLRKENIQSVPKANLFMRRNFIYCQKCQTYKATVVHHLNKKHNDNRLTNFSLLCKKCHIHIHHFSVRGEVRILDLQGWTQFKQAGFDNISTYPNTKREKIFIKLLELCQKQQ